MKLLARKVALVTEHLKFHPLGDSEMRELADSVAFLCSKDARWITALVLNVSSGFAL